MKIAHISDIHAGSTHFVPWLLERAVEELVELRPDVLVVTGDFTSGGYLHEYETAMSYLDQIPCERAVYLPGNHDSRNVGYRHFEELMGSRFRVVRTDDFTIVSVDSSEPDLDGGIVGREWYPWIEENFAQGDPSLRILAMHHHLLPVPGTGRDPSVAFDAGDILEVLVRSKADLVLTGHKHVPWVWRLEDIYISTAGTVSSLLLRGFTQPSYSVVHVSDGRVRIDRRRPGGDPETVAAWSLGSRIERRRRMDAVLETREPIHRS